MSAPATAFHAGGAEPGLVPGQRVGAFPLFAAAITAPRISAFILHLAGSHGHALDVATRAAPLSSQWTRAIGVASEPDDLVRRGRRLPPLPPTLSDIAGAATLAGFGQNPRKYVSRRSHRQRDMAGLEGARRSVSDPNVPPG